MVCTARQDAATRVSLSHTLDSPFSSPNLDVFSLQPDFAIFRRFLAANARDLLRLQGEITHLESDLQSIIAADRVSGDPERAEFEFCIASLKGPPHASRESGLQWQKQVELGHKLATYSQCLSYSLTNPFD